MPDKILILSGNERIFRYVYGFVEISDVLGAFRYLNDFMKSFVMIAILQRVLVVFACLACFTSFAFAMFKSRSNRT